MGTYKGDRELRRKNSRMEKEKIKDTKKAKLYAARSTTEGRAVRREAREQMQELSQRNWDLRKSRTQMGQSPTLSNDNVTGSQRAIVTGSQRAIVTGSQR